MSFPMNDQYWVDAVNFLTKYIKDGNKIVAPNEFEEKFTDILPYSLISEALCDDFQFVVIHKGMMETLGSTFINIIVDKYVPVFANEVFAIFTNHTDIAVLDSNFIHLQSFWQKVKSLKPTYNKLTTGSEETSINKFIASLLKLSKNKKPNINELNLVLRDMKAIRLNIKNFGYELARDLAKTNLNIDEGLNFQHTNLKSKPTTQEDIESQWLKYWCQQLKINPIYHRKIWELCYVPQAICDHFGTDKQQLSGIGFGCGQEPLPSLFASMGWKITVTDLHPDKAKGMGWMETGQHSSMLEQVFYPNIVNRERFEENVSLKYVDMNNISKDLHNSYDFCWSVCALEHLGSINKGLNFIENSLKVLKSGGIAVHTTEYNYTNEPETIDNWPTVIFQNHHFEEIANKLRNQGYDVAELDFNVGNQPLDRFIDIPPYAIGEGWISKDNWNDINQNAHLKLSVDGYPCTCFGLIIKK